MTMEIPTCGSLKLRQVKCFNKLSEQEACPMGPEGSCGLVGSVSENGTPHMNKYCNFNGGDDVYFYFSVVSVTILTNHYYYSNYFYHYILTITFREFLGYDPIFNQSHIKQPRFCGSLEKHTNHQYPVVACSQMIPPMV